MLDLNLEDLDLGSRRKSTEWVAFAPAALPRKKGRPKPKARKPISQAKPERSADADASGDGVGCTWRPVGWQGGAPRPGGAPGALPDKLLRINAGLYGSERRSAAVEWLPPESEEGNTEYKLRLRSPPPPRLQQLITQMQYRLSEGGGVAYYYVGVEDNGYPRGLDAEPLEESLAGVMRMADALDAAAVVDRLLHAPHGRVAVRLRVARLATHAAGYEDARVLLLGGSGAGKSTLASVLCHGADGRPLLDDGRGRARTAVFRHKHEVETGRTSALSQHSVGYDAEGRVINYGGVAAMTQAEVAAEARKLVTLVDAGGHRRFMKTALSGLTAMAPDYAMLCVPGGPAAPAGHDLTAEHLAAAVGLGVPVFVVVTKADLGQEHVLAVQERLSTLLRGGVDENGEGEGAQGAGAGSFQCPQLMSCSEQARAAADGLAGSRHTGLRPLPMFAVSSVTGTGLPLLHSFLLALRQPVPGDCPPAAVGDDDAPKEQRATEQPPAHFQVGCMFEVENVGSVASGTLLAGALAVGDHLWLGPGKRNLFTRCQVTSIHRSQRPVRSIAAGQTATVALHPASAPVLGGLATGSSELDAARRPPVDSDHAQQAGIPAPVAALGGCASAGWRSLLSSTAACSPPSESLADDCARLGSRVGSSDSMFSATTSESEAAQPDFIRRWLHVGLGHGFSTPLPKLSLHRARSRSRGAVLLGAVGADPPAGALEFEAELVLLPGAHWPPRQPPSERRPPSEEARQGSESPPSDSSAQSTSILVAPGDSLFQQNAAEIPMSDASSAEAFITSGTGRRKRRQPASRHRPQHAYVVHCGCARQVAHVVAVDEAVKVAREGGVGDGEVGDEEEAQLPVGERLGNAAEAARLLQAAQPAGRGGSTTATTATARVRFRFSGHAEWLLRGSALLAQDRASGLLAAVGVVTRVFPAEREPY
eukprot:jgi/Tetstr1/435552/TSEL_024455.t1